MPKQQRSFSVDVLWCGNSRQGRSNLWSFPPKVNRKLQADFAGKTVLHLFGGRAKFGTRLDIDPTVRPDVIGDAWMPPFGRDSFDVVILDPPYFTINAQVKVALFRNAAWIAREQVVWFHTIWAAGYNVTKLRESWLVRVGDHCHVRCLQYFDIREPKLPLPARFLRGPAMKYNRWLANPYGLPFGKPLDIIV